ncbi:MAG: carboxypeptidase-like regulatory domain-containing protein [Crocinitomicaceae bacterium]
MSLPFSIVGRTIDMDNAPLPGVVISVDGEGVETTITTVTNSEGQFELRDLPPPSQYLLSATMEGFMDWKKPVVVTPDTTFKVNITMYPE